MDNDKVVRLSVSKPSVKIGFNQNELIALIPGCNETTGISSPEMPFDDQRGAAFDSSANLLSSRQLMDIILYALEKKEPLSIVSVGQTEAFVMAQYTIYSEKEFMSHREAYNANRGEKSGFLHRGIRFPNIEARDAAVEASRKADIIAYNTLEPNAKNLTERVFAAYEIKAKQYFEANIRRVFMFSQAEKFEEILRGRKVLLISSLAQQVKIALEQKFQENLELDIVGAISIYEHEEIPRVKEEIAQYDFDLCLLGAGVNAVILSVYIAETYGKVAFDIGWGMKALLTNQVVTDSFITDIIGLENLLKM